MAVTWDPIAPTERLQSGIDWSPRIGADTIQSSVWSNVTPAGPTKDTPSIVGNVTYIWIQGCTLDVVYSITNTITTLGGQIEVETAQFVCANK